jgi:hypothetical protein
VLLLAGCRLHFDEVALRDDGGRPASACAFGGGSHDRTEARPDGRIGLVPGEVTGTYTTPVCAWSGATRSLIVVPAAPYGKPLPTTSEIDYPGGNLDATALVGLWHLDGPLGPIADDSPIDEASNASAGVARNSNGAGMAYAASVFGAGLECDGLDDYVEIAPNPAWQTFDQVTLQAWASAGYTGPSSQFMRLVSYWVAGDTLGSTFQLSHFPSGAILFMVKELANSFWAGGGDWQQTSGTWHHLVGVYDGVEVALYVNGVDQMRVAFSGPLEQRTGALYFCQGGSGTAPPVYQYHGAIDEVAIWNRALSADEVRALHARGAAAIGVQIRACADPACTGVAFVGPDGTPGTSYSEAASTSPALATFDLSAVPAAPYLQIATTLSRTSGAVDPELVDVIVAR